MTNKISKGDLVVASGLPPIEGQVCMILKGPYPAIFTFEEDGIVCSEETQAADIMCQGRIYPKIKCSLLFKLNFEHSTASDL